MTTWVTSMRRRRSSASATTPPIIEKITSSGTLVHLAGTGVEDEAGDGGPAIGADFGYIYDFAIAADGSILAADFGDDRIRLRRIDPEGFIRTIAGGAYDMASLVPDGTPATAIGYIQHVDVGPDGWVYVFGHQSYRFPPDFDASATQR